MKPVATPSWSQGIKNPGKLPSYPKKKPKAMFPDMGRPDAMPKGTVIGKGVGAMAPRLKRSLQKKGLGQNYS